MKKRLMAVTMVLFLLLSMLPVSIAAGKGPVETTEPEATTRPAEAEESPAPEAETSEDEGTEAAEPEKTLEDEEKLEENEEASNEIDAASLQETEENGDLSESKDEEPGDPAESDQAAPASNEEEPGAGEVGGDFGTDMHWTLSEDGVLTITGTGSIDDPSGWETYKDVITEVYIMPGVTGIGAGAFSGCTALAGVSIPDSVTSIASGAFLGCTSLAAVIIPESVAALAEDAFDPSTELVSDEGDDTGAGNGLVGDDGASAENEENGTEPMAEYGGSFGVGDALKWSFDDGTGVLTISGTGAMENYSEEEPAPWNEYIDSITSVNIEDGVTNIGDYAFVDLNVSSITVPSSVNSIGDYAFAYSALAGIELPDGVGSIGECAFNFCWELSTVNIPSGITSIQYATFWGCSSLASVAIPESVTTIEGGAFQETGLTSITIPSSVTSIQEGAFLACSDLSSVLVPQTVSTIGEMAFGFYSEEELKEDFAIYGYIGSQAEAYTQETGVKFVAIQGVDDDGYEYVVDPEASNTIYILESGGTVTIHSSGELDHFIRLLVDGQEVDKSNYTLAEGSTVLILESDYLDTLEEGDHPAVLEYTDGYAEATITILERNSATPTPAPTSTPEPTPVPTSVPSAQPTDKPSPSGSGNTDTDNTPVVNTVNCSAYVIDPAGEPIADLALELHSTPITATTNQTGGATFGSVEFGTHTFYVVSNRSASLTFRFVPGNKTELDGNTVTAVRGSSVRLKLQYDGTNLILIGAESGAPVTGDNNDIQLWSGMLVLSLAGLAIAVERRRKTQH